MTIIWGVLCHSPLKRMCHGTLPLNLGVLIEGSSNDRLYSIVTLKINDWAGLCPPYVDFGEWMDDGAPGPV